MEVGHEVIITSVQALQNGYTPNQVENCDLLELADASPRSSQGRKKDRKSWKSWTMKEQQQQQQQHRPKCLQNDNSYQYSYWCNRDGSQYTKRRKFLVDTVRLLSPALCSTGRTSHYRTSCFISHQPAITDGNKAAPPQGFSKIAVTPD
ncbi:Hypothetical predicted protein [Podarcis lilfordi]|uniref:Uncharacterized protein n=1 Tax=Podarcis lilfordi TaxID=74358 RepID=A0AA35K390_9SAUR|nr:Hypothetical predicted protein [Podarcis lilfordi]